MSLNGISNVTNVVGSAYEQQSTAKTKAKDTADTASKSTYGSDNAAVYESTTDKTSASTTDRSNLISKLKADAEQRTQQLQNLVTQMFNKQGIKVTSADDMWKRLASGDFTVDKATADQAAADISENGYWGVNQTSDRIFDFAKALSGGDSEKMDQMLSAFKKGFEQATKTWGSALPDISQQTYDSVIKKFDDYKNGITE